MKIHLFGQVAWSEGKVRSVCGHVVQAKAVTMFVDALTCKKCIAAYEQFEPVRGVLYPKREVE